MNTVEGSLKLVEMQLKNNNKHNKNIGKQHQKQETNRQPV